MAKHFNPFFAEDKLNEYVKILMNGDGIRTDKGHDYSEVIPRDLIKSANGCVGSGDYERLLRADDVLKDAIKTVKKEGYIVLTKDCSDIHTGRFKATTYYLAGE